MPATLIATAGAADANSYATVAEADAYFENIYSREEWDALADDTKAKLLITATLMIEKLPFGFDKYSATQALKFPMDIGGVADGMSDAKLALYNQAWYFYTYSDTIDEAISDSIANLTTENLGKIQRSKASSGFNMFRAYDSYVFVALRDYLNMPTERFRG